MMLDDTPPTGKINLNSFFAMLNSHITMSLLL